MLQELAFVERQGWRWFSLKSDRSWKTNSRLSTWVKWPSPTCGIISTLTFHKGKKFKINYSNLAAAAEGRNEEEFAYLPSDIILVI